MILTIYTCDCQCFDIEHTLSFDWWDGKNLRIYDLNSPNAPHREVDMSPGSVRTVAWLYNDQTILSSCTEIGVVRYFF